MFVMVVVGPAGVVGEVIELVGVEGVVLPSAGVAGAALALQRLLTLLNPEAHTQAVPLQTSFSLLQGLAWIDTLGADEDPLEAEADPLEAVEAVADPIEAVDPLEAVEAVADPVGAAGAELLGEVVAAASWVLLQAFLDPG
jgi:hypothetical protein